MDAIERKPHCDREGDRGEVMKEPDEVAAMLRLKELGWGVRRIARELGCSHMTVRRYVAAGGRHSAIVDEWRVYLTSSSAASP